ncbi:MAG: creatininase family protein [Planctomycetaceae bacterium]|nr:creatininase family protein [Planctomycetaceae bacterium]
MKYAEMTSPQLASVDRDQTVVVVPIAAVEQHGPHMPTGTDTLICTAVAEGLESQLPTQVLVTPTFWLGASAHHLRFGATLDADLLLHIQALENIGQCLLDDGFMRLLFVNGHGGNVDPLKVALRRLQVRQPDALLVGGSYWDVGQQVMEETLEGDHKSVGHACEFETSLMLHLHPHLVDQSQVRNAGPLVTDRIDNLFVSRDMRQRTREGCTGFPELATAEKGSKLFEGIVLRLHETVQRLLSEPLGTEFTDWFTADA